MTSTLLNTKFYIPPVRPEHVHRPNLYQLLDQGLARRLTLISAPTGFGKSTLVAGWLSDREQPAAWLSLDSGDNDPARFWNYLIAAIQTIHSGIGIDARQIVSAPQLRSSEPATINLINDITQLGRDLVLILDDYHIIEAGQVHAGISYLLENQPPNLHIIVLTRVDPPITLARLRAQSQLVEIRAEDLQFTIEETSTLLNQNMGFNLQPAQIERLSAHTERWAVGLQLAALSLKDQSSHDTFIDQFTGGNQFILDYLVEEVLDTLPDSLRSFLLRTSILERFCPELCQAVTGDSSGPSILQQVRDRNLFLIPLGSDGRWFRYHHLFAEVLNTLLEQSYPDEIGSLHRKAAVWFESQGHPGEAVDHALRSGDLPWASELVVNHSIPFMHRGEVATVQRWLDALPVSRDTVDPLVPLARCWTLFISGQGSSIEPHLERAVYTYDRLVEQGSLSGSQKGLIAAQLAMMRSVLARSQGDHAESVAHAEEAVRLVPSEMLDALGTQWNMLAAARAGASDFNGAIEAYGRGIELAYTEGNLVGAYGCTYGQAMYLIVQGRLNDAERLCRSAIDRAASEGHGDFPAAGSLYMTLARIIMERYRLEEVEAYLNTGLRIARPGGFGEAMRTGRYLRAHLSAALGDLDAAAHILKDTERILLGMDDPYLTGEINWQWTAVSLKAGDFKTAREKLHILEEMIAATQHANLLLAHRGLYPRLLWAERRYEQALPALDDSIRETRAVNSYGELVRLLPLQALVQNAEGDRKAAFVALREAIALGAPEGYIWRWLDAGPEIEPLLRDLRGDPETSQEFHPYLDSLLDACTVEFGEASPAQQADLSGPLTPRELEIMRLISKGYSNPDIAGELVVTLNTIKKHTSNIYSKLGVRSRTQAIARASELNLF